MITININGKEIELDEPTTVLKAAKKAGIKIPTLCHHDILKAYGGCRLCVVEIERMPKLQNSCTMTAADGMVIKTESDEISNVRRGILELLLINHPLDCPYCDKAGECELQDLVDKYGPTVGRYKEDKRKVPASHQDQILSRNMERCVVCTRCVRMCDSVQGASAIDIIGRGNRSRMEPFSSASFDCEYCGNCLTVCPVGAILSRLSLHSFRPWQIDREVETICPYCGVGCTVVAQIRDESIKRVIPRIGRGVNNGLLCSRGRFGYEFISASDRLKGPLVRKEGKLVESTWSDALKIVADKLKETRDTAGGSAIAGIASSRCTNEDNYVFQKFLRMACNTNNIDSVSRIGYVAAQRYIEDVLGQGVTANMISGIKNSDTILVAGGDPSSVNPVLGLAIRAAVKDGAKLAVIGHAKGLERYITIKVIPPVFKESEVLESLLTGIFMEKGRRDEKPAVDNRIEELSRNSQDIDTQGIKELLLKGESVSIITGMELVQRTDGHRALFAIAGLTYLLEARLNLLSDKPNEQGIVDMGCLPDMLPGERPVDISNFRNKYETAWNGQIPGETGKSLLEMLEGAKNGQIKAMYIMGENPVFNVPDGHSVKEALKALDFLVVQDIFLSETAELADVVLPSLGWSEKAGTYTNLERRIQLLKKAVNVDGIDDWKIITEVSNEMGYKMNYSGPENIMHEIARVSPLYRDLTYEEISEGNSLWPYNGEPLRGEVKDMRSEPREKREFNAGSYLSLEKLLFHSGTLSRRSRALRKICPDPVLKIGLQHAEDLKLKDGDNVKISTDRGSFDLPVSLERSIEDNKVLLSNNFEGRGVFSLLSYSIDPITKAPGIEGCEIKIEKRQGNK